MKILVAGYPYVRETFMKLFDHFPEDARVDLLLPKKWKIKKGKSQYIPPVRPNIRTTSALFHHSDYPLIGGLLKGWMPALPLYLRGYDILYSPSEPVLLTTVYNGIWARLFGIKHVIFTWENIDYSAKFSGINLLIKKILLRINFALADGVVCGNKKAEAIVKKYSNKPTSVIPLSGVDPDFFKPLNKQESKQYYGLENKFVLSFVGAIDKRKGVDLIINSLAKLRPEINDMRLILVGGGTYENEINEMINRLGLSEIIVRIPWADHAEIIKVFSASDVFLYPSISFQGWEEQFGYSIAEAQLMEVPVISTLSGSIDEVAVNGETALLVEQNNTEGLSGAIVKLYSDRDFRTRLGRDGRKYVVDNFSHSIVANKYYNFFNKIYGK